MVRKSNHLMTPFPNKKLSDSSTSKTKTDVSRLCLYVRHHPDRMGQLRPLAKLV